MTTLDNENITKMRRNFECKLCDYYTSRKDNYIRHLSTTSHKKTTQITTNNNAKEEEICNKYYSCNNCEKKFNDRAGLWRHKKKCLPTNDSTQHNTNHNEPNDKELIMMLIKENNELRNIMTETQIQLTEIIKNGTHNNSHNNNNNNTNSHNKTFNLQFFLNETCKNAMNITDFVESITLQLSDLESVGELGYVEGISNIITTNLKALDVTQRPIHCTDKKRETLYVKDEDKWEKDNNEKKKIRKVIKHIAHKNSKLIPEFKDKYPDCVKSDSKKSDQYNNLIIEAMGGHGDNDVQKEDQIITNITKEVAIDKYIELEK
jgi:hypothetical protein